MLNSVEVQLQMPNDGLQPTLAVRSTGAEPEKGVGSLFTTPEDAHVDDTSIANGAAWRHDLPTPHCHAGGRFGRWRVNRPLEELLGYAASDL